MRVAEFEQAIDAKGARILEMRLFHNHVKNAFGRIDNKVIIWDDQGYAFSAIMPDGIDDACLYFQSGIYWTTIEDIVVGSDGTLTIGASKSEKRNDGDWMVADNFRLIYLGSNLLIGDVNRDGSVTIADVTALVNIILGKDNGDAPIYDHTAADVNKDNSVTIADVTALVNILLGKTNN